MATTTTDLTTRQTEALRRASVGSDENNVPVYWPTGHDVLVLRALARRGLLTETTGRCEGCRSHTAGHAVPVFLGAAAST